MTQTSQQLRDGFKMYGSEYGAIEPSIDLSRMNFSNDYFASIQNRMHRAFVVTEGLRAGTESKVNRSSGTSAAQMIHDIVSVTIKLPEI
jgi:hypothetical protein